MRVVLDDRLLIEELLVGLDVGARTSLHTTSNWYFRACRAGRAAGRGYLSGAFEGLSPDAQELGLASLLQLPASIGLPDPRQVVPTMVEVWGRYRDLNRLNLEAVASAQVLDAAVWLTPAAARGVLPRIFAELGGSPSSIVGSMAEEAAGSGAAPQNGNRGGGQSAGGGGGNRNRNRNRNRSGGGGSGGGGHRNGGSGGGGGNRNNQRSRQGGGSGGTRSAQGNRTRSSSGTTRVAPAPEVLTPLVIEPGLGATEILPAEVSANRRRAVLLCTYAAVIPAVVIGAVLAVAVMPAAAAGGLVVGFVIGYALWRSAPTTALRRIGAVELSEHDNPRLFNVTEGLCATFGLRMPAMFVVFDAVPNACALGRDAVSADLVVTSGLLELMGPIELEGVIAHELAHVKRGDNGVSSIALALGRFGGESMVKRCVGGSREYRADVVGASAVRFPRGLLDALRLMEAGPAPAGNSVFSAERFGASRWIWIDPSVGARDEPVPIGDLNPTSVRVAALSEW